MQPWLTVRAINLAGFLICAGMMAFALYTQYVGGMDPCPLCTLQRVAVIALGIVFLVGALRPAGGWGRYVFGAAFLLAGGYGVVVAGRHVWLQSLPPDEVPACGPGLEYMLDAFPLGEALKKVFAGSGECAEIVWQFLGLSMPSWVLVWCVILGLGGALNNLRRNGTV